MPKGRGGEGGKGKKRWNGNERLKGEVERESFHWKERPQYRGEGEGMSF